MYCGCCCRCPGGSRNPCRPGPAGTHTGLATDTCAASNQRSWLISQSWRASHTCGDWTTTRTSTRQSNSTSFNSWRSATYSLVTSPRGRTLAYAICGKASENTSKSQEFNRSFSTSSKRRRTTTTTLRSAAWLSGGRPATDTSPNGWTVWAACTTTAGATGPSSPSPCRCSCPEPGAPVHRRPGAVPPPGIPELLDLSECVREL